MDSSDHRGDRVAAKLVESRMRGDSHVRFGGRPAETDRPRGWHRAAGRPYCRAPAHRADTDHSVEHARGGATTDAGLASACRHDHRLRHEGDWTVEHTEPGQLIWISPLGRRYRTRPPPGLLDLPEPRPGAIDERDAEPDPEHPLPGWDPISCLQPQPPPAPPPAKKRARNPDWIFGRPGGPDDEPPPF